MFQLKQFNHTGRWLAAFGLALLASGQATAGLLLDRAIVVFENGGVSKQDITVINDNPDERLFVSVEPYEVTQPGTDAEQLIRSDEPENPAFIATPAKLIVEPGSTSVVRLLNIHPAEQTEKIFRVNFLPIVRPPELASDDDAEGVKPVLQITVAYQALIIVPPLEPAAKPVFSREGTLARFSNPGNSNYLLSKGRQCNPADPEECLDLQGKRIYPGNEWEMTLPFDGPFEFSLRTLSGTRGLIVP